LIARKFGIAQCGVRIRLKTEMKRKESSGREPVGDPPSSSHPEAEAGVMFGRATRSLSGAGQTLPPPRKLHKPIVSIHGRDVESVPDGVDDGLNDSKGHAA
jgi:hypothetical protein